MPNPNPICIVGLGYVGLPLGHAFAKKGYDVIGYDISKKRIDELKSGKDRTNELTGEQLREVSIRYTDDPTAIHDATIIIMALPTPVDEKNVPDMTLLKEASKSVGKHLKKGAIVVYESTVYPGITEELCGPILEKESGLVCGKDFTLGYSPERINPGDKEHTVTKIKKVVAGQDERTANILCDLYGSIIEAGIHRAPGIRVAEMAKAIENAQRDLNIAYVNEISMLCKKIGIEAQDVLEAAGTKWNFLRFQPGLVGGHCIGVDPYYLLEMAAKVGCEMPIVTAARHINDGMAAYVALRICAALREIGKDPAKSSILVMGLTFKENVPDTRNSQSSRVIEALKKEGCTITAHDPYAGTASCHTEHSRSIDKMPSTQEQLNSLGTFDAIALLVPHKEYCELPPGQLSNLGKKESVFFDLKGIFRRDAASFFRYLSL